MSGGETVRTADSGGGSPVLHKPKARKDGETAGCARSKCGGLGLDGGRGRRPQTGKNVSPSGLADDAQGMEAEWPRPPTAGSVHDSPTRRGGAQTVVFTEASEAG